MCNFAPILVIPDLNLTLKPYNIVKLDRFDTTEWIIQYGWYQFDNNRKLCGWYLLSNDANSIVKPLTDADIIDIYQIKYQRKED